MPVPNFKGKRDASEGLIVEALQAAGCTVIRTDQPFDLVVSHPALLGKVVALVECKTGNAKLNEKQRDISKRIPVHIVRNDKEAIALVNSWRGAVRVEAI